MKKSNFVTLCGAEAADGLGVPLGVAERGGRILPAAGRDALRPAAGRAHVGSPARAAAAETGTKGLSADGMADVVLGVAMSGMIVQMVRDGRTYSYPGVVIYAMAAYVFYNLTVTTVNLARLRRQQDWLLAAGCDALRVADLRGHVHVWAADRAAGEVWRGQASVRARHERDFGRRGLCDHLRHGRGHVPARPGRTAGGRKRQGGMNRAG